MPRSNCALCMRRRCEMRMTRATKVLLYCFADSKSTRTVKKHLILLLGLPFIGLFFCSIATLIIVPFVALIGSIALTIWRYPVFFFIIMPVMILFANGCSVYWFGCRQLSNQKSFSECIQLPVQQKRKTLTIVIVTNICMLLLVLIIILNWSLSNETRTGIPFWIMSGILGLGVSYYISSFLAKRWYRILLCHVRKRRFPIR